jgi:hypothetical protein
MSELLKTRRGDYEVPALMRWRDREPQPTFEAGVVPLIGQTTKIAAIGSCFAERVVEVLESRGLPTTFHPTGLQYNTFSIIQEFDHLFGPEDPYGPDEVVQGADGRWEHPFRKELRADSREQVAVMEAEADRIARQAYTEADVIVITLGLTEIWERIADGRVAVELPPQPLYAAGLYRHRNSTVAENISNLERIRARLREATDAEILVTVSPVPLHATFRPLDVVLANCESKSRLRAATADFVQQYPDVHYFHSYELVVSGTDDFFLEDGRHVSPQGVAFIMNEFLRMYGKPDLRPEFVPFGEVAMPDQTVGRRVRNLKSRVAKKVRRLKGLEG